MWVCEVRQVNGNVNMRVLCGMLTVNCNELMCVLCKAPIFAGNISSSYYLRLFQYTWMHDQVHESIHQDDNDKAVVDDDDVQSTEN